ncbi:MAG: ATP-binding protein, partial [Chloroflexota bacterium]
HADAGRVDLALSYAQHHLQLEIRDNGKGFDLAVPNGSGYGLSNMRQRIEQLNGTFGINTAPQKGCTITAMIPIQKNGQD